MNNLLRTFAGVASLVIVVGSISSLVGAPPHHEHAYVNGRIVTISVQDPHPGQVAKSAQNTYYEVSYPEGWNALTSSVPQCNPCDHVGDGDSPDDYHDHVFSAEPSQPEKGGYGPLWSLSLVLPNSTGNPTENAAIAAAYAKFLPTTSAQQVVALLAAKLPNTSIPLAVRVDIDYVFLAAIVNSNASR
jgi:hypothetical protein